MVLGKIIKTRSKSKKPLQQDENAVPSLKDDNLVNIKEIHKKPAMLESQIEPVRKNNQSAILNMKSPIFRDRTNITHELTKVGFSSKQKNKIKSNRNKDSGKQKISKKVPDIKDVKLLSNVQVSLQKYTVKKILVEKENIRNNVNNYDQEKLNESKSTCITANQIEQNVGETKKKYIKNLESNNIHPIHNKVFKKQSISREVIEKLLNQDDEEDIESDVTIAMKTRDSKTETVENNIESSIGKQELMNEQKNNLKSISNDILIDQQVNRKFFKNKETEKELKLVIENKKNTEHRVIRKKNIRIKKTENNDDSFKLKIKEQRKSIIPLKKNLRTRTIKNYCEVSKLEQSLEENSINFKKPNNERDKGVPIYKIVQLSPESIKDVEEVYNFPDDSQESKQSVKKRKKVVKKPTIKKPKKMTVSKSVKNRKMQNKSFKKITRHVQFDDQIEEPKDIRQTIVAKNTMNKLIVPDHLQQAGDSTIGEASTIKILSDQILEQSKRIDLTVTPLVPKTIASELKLYGPKNVITAEPTTLYKNMLNHSLIRKSISPIKKLIENFDAGSPWRPVDPFSRVQNVVQSTPQINKLSMIRAKNPQVRLINLNNKSINLEDSLHKDKTLHNKIGLNLNSPTIPEESQKKLRTGISNSNDTNHINAQNLKSSEKLDEMTCSPVQIISPVMNVIEESIADQETIQPNFDTDNKENKISRKSPKKKFSTPSPFRFEKIRSSKRIASIEFQSKSLECTLNKEKEIEPEAGPSNFNKLESPILRQSNLNNFLNLQQMPESTHILTKHGIFDDAYSTPISGKKPKNLFEEANIENAFGFDDFEMSEVSPIVKSTSTSRIATEKDVKESVKGKLFPKARVKSSISTKICDNEAKKTMLKNVLKKKVESTVPDSNKNQKEKDNINIVEENNNEPNPTNKALQDAASFSDTFDVLSENGDPQRTPDSIPLFVDLEPVHFTQPARRSYNKRKREVCFHVNKNDCVSSEDEYEKPKNKKKKESKLNKQELKRMQAWIKNVNDTFNEIDHFDLVVE